MMSNPDVPPFIGYVETTVHALRLIQAARQGVIPRLARRLNGSERRTMIRSGAVFVFNVEESGIVRWTDGLLWSPSRIVGNFLVYRQVNERSSLGQKKSYPQGSPSLRSLMRHNLNSPYQLFCTSFANGRSNYNQDKFRPSGLIKKTITVTIEGSDFRLISYYKSEDIRAGTLKVRPVYMEQNARPNINNKHPTSRQGIMNLYIPPHLFQWTSFNLPRGPKIRLDGMQSPGGEDRKIEGSGYHIPRSSGSPTLRPLFHSHNLPHSNVYLDGRSSTGDRWSVSGTENLPSSRFTLQETMAPAPHSSYLSIARRRDNGRLTPPRSRSFYRVNSRPQIEFHALIRVPGRQRQDDLHSKFLLEGVHENEETEVEESWTFSINTDIAMASFHSRGAEEKPPKRLLRGTYETKSQFAGSDGFSGSVGNGRFYLCTDRGVIIKGEIIGGPPSGQTFAGKGTWYKA